MSLSPQLRTWSFYIHTWCGLAVALYAIVIGVSGSLLVWQDELEALEYPEFHSAPPARISTTADQVLETVRRVIPEGRPISVTWPNDDTPYWMSYVLLKVGAQEVYVDPASGMVRGMRDTQGGWVGVLSRLHTNLLAGSTGRKVNSYAAIILVLLCLSGAILWWPGAGHVRNRFRLSWISGWWKFGWKLHHVTGAVSVVFIALLSITGTYFYWSSSYVRAVSTVFARTAEPPIGQVEPGSSVLSASQLEAAARASFPGLPLHRLAILDAPTSSVRATFREGTPGEFHLVSTAFLHPVTGAVIGRNPLAARPAGDAILSWFSALHFGVFGGMLIKIVWTVLGLSLPVLGISGGFMWWRRVIQPRLGRRRIPLAAVLLLFVLMPAHFEAANRLRVVSLSAPLAETMYALGALDQLVGAVDAAVFPEQIVKDKKSGKVRELGSFARPDLALLDQLHPDLILSDTGFHTALAAELRAKGHKVLHFEPRSLEKGISIDARQDADGTRRDRGKGGQTAEGPRLYGDQSRRSVDGGVGFTGE
jgi:uncharacterized iron-regulated membrane protein